MLKEEVVKIIKEKFSDLKKVKIPLLRGNNYFTAEIIEDGIMVNNLGGSPFLPWDVFTESINLIERLGGIASKGDAMIFCLGEKGLDLNTIESFIASKIYNKRNGEKIFRRITPIANILIWSGICINIPGKLSFKIKIKNLFILPILYLGGF